MDAAQNPLSAISLHKLVFNYLQEKADEFVLWLSVNSLILISRKQLQRWFYFLDRLFLIYVVIKNKNANEYVIMTTVQCFVCFPFKHFSLIVKSNWENFISEGTG